MGVVISFVIMWNIRFFVYCWFNIMINVFVYNVVIYFVFSVILNSLVDIINLVVNNGLVNIEV